MARQHRSDYVPERPEGKPVTKLHDSGAVGATAAASEETLVKAACYLGATTKNSDLWEVLGLGEFVNARREALGLAAMPGVRRAAKCPNCGVDKGPCRSEEDKPRRRWHIARTRVMEMGEQA